MPNVATLVGATAAGMSMGPGCDEEDEKTVKQLFGARARAIPMAAPDPNRPRPGPRVSHQRRAQESAALARSGDAFLDSLRTPRV